MLISAQKTQLLHEHFPKLSEREIQNLHEFLDDYCDLLWRVFDRLEREKKPGFDPRLDAS
jgi:hypothetical protein